MSYKKGQVDSWTEIWHILNGKYHNKLKKLPKNLLVARNHLIKLHKVIFKKEVK